MKIKIVDQILSQKCFWTVIFSCWIFIGIILSIFDSSLKNNYVYVLGVNSLLLAQIITYRNLMKKERNVSTSISGTKVNGLPLFSILSKNGDYLNKWYSITVSFTIGVTYFVSLILLKVLIWNELITIYGAINPNCIYCNTIVFKVSTLYSYLKKDFKIRVYYIDTSFST